MSERKRPNLEDLAIVKLCEPWPGWRDEAAVMASLKDVSPADFPSLSQGRSLIEKIGDFLSPLHRSMAFCIDRDVLSELVCDGRDDGMALPPMPPLPAKWVAIQSTDNSSLTAFDGGGHFTDGRPAPTGTPRIVAMVIAEIATGAKWRVLEFGFLLQGELTHPAYTAFDLTPDTFIPCFDTHRGPAGTVFALDDKVPDAARTAVEAAHLITSRGVSLATIKAESRAERRRLERRNVSLPTSLYWVDVRAQAETSQLPGAVIRNYHCRWLVRGHWRQIGSDQRTWIRPYVKGPAGTPWRGRPIYHVVA